MGVDAELYVPVTARLEDVAQAMGILAGLPYTEGSFGSPDVTGLRWENGSACGPYRPMQMVLLSAPEGETLIDGERGHMAYYHGVTTGVNLYQPAGMHHFSLRSTAFWIGVGAGIVDFFGGVLDVNDCDSSEVDFKKRARAAAPNDGDAYSAYYASLLKHVTPLTRSDLEMYDVLASYRLDGARV